MPNDAIGSISQTIQRIKRDSQRNERLCARGNQYAKSIRPTVEGILSLPQELYFDRNENLAVFINDPTGVSRASGEGKAKEHPQHSHACFELCYVFSGSCQCWVDGKKLFLQAGSVCLINGCHPHCIVPQDEQTDVIRILIRPDAFSSDLMHLLDPENAFFLFFMNAQFHPERASSFVRFFIAPNTTAQTYLLHIVQEYFAQDKNSQKLMMHLLCCLFIDLPCAEKQPQNVLPCAPGLDIETVLAFIHQHCATITLVELAEHFHYSARYLSDFISQQTGKHFSKILSSARLRKAKELLAHTELSIEIITHTVGYEYRSSFEASFKKEFHITPKQYRMSCQEHPASLLPVG